MHLIVVIVAQTGGNEKIGPSKVHHGKVSNGNDAHVVDSILFIISEN